MSMAATHPGCEVMVLRGGGDLREQVQGRQVPGTSGAGIGITSPKIPHSRITPLYYISRDDEGTFSHNM